MPVADWIADGARIEGGAAAVPPWAKSGLSQRVADYAEALVRALPARSVIGLAGDNGPQWIAVDLATQAANMALVPLPAFFTRAQLEHVVRASALQALFCADATPAAALGFRHEIVSAHGMGLYRASDPPHPGSLPGDTQKITFTSGTTGEPRGVLLSIEQQLVAVRALAAATAKLGISRHLCALPLPVLLENVAGAYTALALGATCVCPPLADVGMSGASGFDAERFLDAVARHRPDSVILLPQMLQALVARLAAGRTPDPRIGSLRFVPVGGAKTPPALIVRARELGLPVYEGYGLTECASVVSLNLPGADRVGTVGRPLPGMQVRAAPDGELEIAGRCAIGYLDATTAVQAPWLKTGDLGTIDREGYVSISGRKKNVLVTSFGRNVSPEWPETLLVENGPVAQAAVFGDGCPALVAIVVPASAGLDDAALEAAVSAANARLPDYARIGTWIRAAEPFTVENGLATPNGRPRRDAIAASHAHQLERAYDRMKIPS